METNDKQRFLKEEILEKVRDSKIPHEELVRILADILFEAFLWQRDQMRIPTQERDPQEKK